MFEIAVYLLYKEQFHKSLTFYFLSQDINFISWIKTKQTFMKKFLRREKLLFILITPFVLILQVSWKAVALSRWNKILS